MKERKYRICGTCGNSYRTTSKRQQFICRKCKGLACKFRIEYAPEKLPSTWGINHLMILSYLNLEDNYRTAREISKFTKTPLKTVYKRLLDLLDAYLISKLDNGYILSDKAKRTLLKLKGWDYLTLFKRIQTGEKINVRFHNLQGRYYVEEPIKNYNNYLGKFMNFHVGRTKNNFGMKINFPSATVIISSPRSISVTFRDILVPCVDSGEWSQGHCLVGELIDSLVIELERVFSGLKIDSFRPFGLDSQHIAIKDSIYAKRYYEKNGCGTKTDRFTVDRSNNHYELESINLATAGTDFGFCLALEHKARENDPSLVYNQIEIKKMEDIFSFNS